MFPINKLTILLIMINLIATNCKLPLIINTWNFSKATKVAFETLKNNGTALDAVEAGCSEAESDLSIDSVGWGAHPDENGETTLDAIIFDGPSHKVGAVGDLRRIKNAISVARKVLENTEITLIAGDQATRFAVQMGFEEISLSSNKSIDDYNKWRVSKCQPNFWMNVTPDPKSTCGPYKPKKFPKINNNDKKADPNNHDTIGMIVISKDGKIVAGTTTNGLNHKIAGRVGDTPIPGSGAYVDQDIGAAVETGDGDVMMRFAPTYQAVENLRLGYSPKKAARDVMQRIYRKYKKAEAAVIVADKDGNYGAACIGFEEFPFSVINLNDNEVVIKKVKCLNTN